MNDAVDSLFVVVRCKSNKKNDCISTNDFQVTIVYGDVEGLIPAWSKLSDGLDDISQVA